MSSPLNVGGAREGAVWGMVEISRLAISGAAKVTGSCGEINGAGGERLGERLPAVYLTHDGRRAMRKGHCRADGSCFCACILLIGKAHNLRPDHIPGSYAVTYRPRESDPREPAGQRRIARGLLAAPLPISNRIFGSPAATILCLAQIRPDRSEIRRRTHASRVNPAVTS